MGQIARPGESTGDDVLGPTSTASTRTRTHTLSRFTNLKSLYGAKDERDFVADVVLIAPRSYDVTFEELGARKEGAKRTLPKRRDTSYLGG